MFHQSSSLMSFWTHHFLHQNSIPSFRKNAMIDRRTVVYRHFGTHSCRLHGIFLEYSSFVTFRTLEKRAKCDMYVLVCRRFMSSVTYLCTAQCKLVHNGFSSFMKSWTLLRNVFGNSSTIDTAVLCSVQHFCVMPHAIGKYLTKDVVTSLKTESTLVNFDFPHCGRKLTYTAKVLI